MYAIFAVLAVAAEPRGADAITLANQLPPVIRSAGSGPWSAAATWDGGKVPATGDRVLIRGGHRVVLS